MALEIFRLVGSVFVDTEKAEESLHKTDKNAESVGKNFLSVIKTAGKFGAAIVAGATAAGTALFSVSKKAAEATDTIDKMSQKIGVSREAYQELDFILSQNGMDVNVLQSGMKTMVNTMQSAQAGTKSAVNTFKTLGVVVKNNDGTLRKQEDVFYDVISALQAMENETERNALANDIFGRSASELTPLLNSGAGSMENLRNKAHELGLVIGDEAVDAGVQFTDSLDAVKRSSDSVKTQIGVALIPIFQKLLDWILLHMPEIQKTVSVVCTAIGTAITIVAGCIGNIISLVQTVVRVVNVDIPAAADNAASAFADAVGNIQNKWNGLKQWFSNLLNGIVSIFGTIGSAIGNAFKPPLNAIISSINGFIRGLNKIKIPSWVPSVGGRGFSISTIPYLEEGAVLERGQTGFLEGNGAEAVVPLHNNKKWISAVAEDMAASGIGGNSASSDELLKEFLRFLAELPYILVEALDGTKFELNNREFGRLVKAVS